MTDGPDSGLRFGRYQALVRLGRGGMAEVFAARLQGEAGFHKLVAVKRMLPHLAEDSELVERFLDEARIAANIHSAHVIQTLDLGRADDGSPYIVLDLVVGVTLAQLARASAADPARTMPLASRIEHLAQVAEGLADAHEAQSASGQPLGLVHRDVSPQNVLVGIDGRARLADFGIARAATSHVRTRTGRLLGKFGYMSPEQAEGLALDARSDVFSLGVVAWEVLSGKRLFASDTDAKTLSNVLHLPIPELTAVCQVPRGVAEVVESALVRDADRRCSSARQLARGLRAAALNALGPAPDGAEIAQWVSLCGGEALHDLNARITGAAGPHTAELRTATAPGLAGAVSVGGTEGMLELDGEDMQATALRSEPPRGPADVATLRLPADCSVTAVDSEVAPTRLLTRPDRRPRRPSGWVVAMAVLIVASGAAIAAALAASGAFPSETVRPADDVTLSEHGAAEPPAPARAERVVPEPPGDPQGPAEQGPAPAEVATAEDRGSARQDASVSDAGAARGLQARQERARRHPHRRPRPEVQEEPSPSVVRPGMLVGLEGYDRERSR